MNRMMAIVEREMRKFFRSPALMLASMIFPLVQLIILGNAFGGKIRDARVAIVDQDRGPQALRDPPGLRFGASEHSNFHHYRLRRREAGCAGCAQRARLEGAVIIPPQYSQHVYESNHPRIGLVVDNSDNFMSSAIEAELTDLTNR